MLQALGRSFRLLRDDAWAIAGEAIVLGLYLTPITYLASLIHPVVFFLSIMFGAYAWQVLKYHHGWFNTQAYAEID